MWFIVTQQQNALVLPYALGSSHSDKAHVEEQQSLAAFVVVTIFMTFQSNTCGFWGEKFQQNAMSVRTTYEDTNKRDCAVSTSHRNIKQHRKKKEKEKEKLWDFSDSNQGPIDLQSNALPAAPKSQLHLNF